MKPVLKWVGGKTKLLPELVKRLPSDLKERRYVEPFCGGAALYFHLENDGTRLAPVLNDLNEHLMNCYQTVAKDVDGVIDVLEHLARRHSKTYYYEVRDAWNEPDDPHGARRAAMFIYLNKTCFNGVWRVNRRGGFNVPAGDYRRPAILDADGLCAAARLLAHTTILYGSYEDFFDGCGGVHNLFVYFDPPYAPVSATANFTSYTADGFDTGDQERLAEIFRELDLKGAKLMLSNSDVPLIRKLYKHYRIYEVSRSGSINSKTSARGRVSELIITNYKE